MTGNEFDVRLAHYLRSQGRETCGETDVHEFALVSIKNAADLHFYMKTERPSSTAPQRRSTSRSPATSSASWTNFRNDFGGHRRSPTLLHKKHSRASVPLSFGYLTSHQGTGAHECLFFYRRRHEALYYLPRRPGEADLLRHGRYRAQRSGVLGYLIDGSRLLGFFGLVILPAMAAATLYHWIFD